MTEQEGRTDSAVTISVFLQSPHGREADFETYLTGISDAAEEFPGFVDVRAFRPRGSGQNYRIVLGFDSERSLERCQESDERTFWAEHAEELSDGLPRVANITGTAQEQPLSLALSPIEEFVRT